MKRVVSITGILALALAASGCSQKGSEAPAEEEFETSDEAAMAADAMEHESMASETPAADAMAAEAPAAEAMEGDPFGVQEAQQDEGDPVKSKKK